MDQADDNSLTVLLTKRAPVRFRKVVNTCTERRVEKCMQRTAWILSHVLRKTLCEHVNGLCPAGWLNEQSITKHLFQSVRTCPYSWATGRNSTKLIALRLAIKMMRLYSDHQVLCDRRDSNHKHFNETARFTYCRKPQRREKNLFNIDTVWLAVRTKWQFEILSKCGACACLFAECVIKMG